jgi:hypothetical protein
MELISEHTNVKHTKWQMPVCAIYKQHFIMTASYLLCMLQIFCCVFSLSWSNNYKNNCEEGRKSSEEERYSVSMAPLSLQDTYF